MPFSWIREPKNFKNESGNWEVLIEHKLIGSYDTEAGAKAAMKIECDRLISEWKAAHIDPKRQETGN